MNIEFSKLVQESAELVQKVLTETKTALAGLKKIVEQGRAVWGEIEQGKGMLRGLASGVKNFLGGGAVLAAGLDDEAGTAETAARSRKEAVRWEGRTGEMEALNETAVRGLETVEYTVKKEDTLMGIARAMSGNEDDLLDKVRLLMVANGLEDTAIAVGQALRVPVLMLSVEQVRERYLRGREVEYVAQKQDNITKILREHEVLSGENVAEFQAINGLPDAKIAVGEVYRVAGVYGVEFHESLWSTLEDAGFDPRHYKAVYEYNRRLNPDFAAVGTVNGPYAAGMTVMVPEKFLETFDPEAQPGGGTPVVDKPTKPVEDQPEPVEGEAVVGPTQPGEYVLGVDVPGVNGTFYEFEKGIRKVSNELAGKQYFLDPGHGGDNARSVFWGVQEHEVVYDVTNRLFVLLKQHGADVHTTVVSPTGPHVTDQTSFRPQKNEVYYGTNTKVFKQKNGDPRERRRVVNAMIDPSKPSMFLSIHTNGASSGSKQGQARGFEVLVRRGCDYKTAERLRKQKKYEALHEAVMRGEQVDADVKFAQALLAAAKQQKQRVRSGLLKGIDPAKEGIQFSGTGVLTNDTNARIKVDKKALVELAFHDNEKDAKLLSSPIERQRYAEMLFDGIVRSELGITAAELRAQQEGVAQNQPQREVAPAPVGENVVEVGGPGDVKFDAVGDKRQLEKLNYKTDEAVRAAPKGLTTAEMERVTTLDRTFQANREQAEPMSEKAMLEMIYLYAKEVEAQYGVPLEVCMVQTVQESGWGKNQLQKTHLNFHGLKDPNGKPHNSPEGPDGDQMEVSLFGDYGSVLESFSRYGARLRWKAYTNSTAPLYGEAFEKTTPQAFLQTIADVGYAGDKNYVKNCTAVWESIVRENRMPELTAKGYGMERVMSAAAIGGL